MDIERGETIFREWTPISDPGEYDMQLDEGSLQVLSAASMRSVVGALVKANMLPTEYVLEAFNIPNG